MKNVFRQMLAGILGVLLCALLSGCTIGEYRIFDSYTDESGEQHFMVFGEIGPSGGEKG